MTATQAARTSPVPARDARDSTAPAGLHAPPPGLLVLALLLWGVRSDIWPLGLAFGVVLEAARFSDFRWQVRSEDLRRIWDLCVVLLVGIGAWSFVVHDGAGIVGGMLDRGPAAFGSDALQKATEGVLGFFRWWPAAFLPLALAQYWGTLDRVPLSIISWLARQQALASQTNSAAGSRVPAGPGLHIGYPYLALCLVAAGASNRPDPWFFWATAGLLALAAWPNRSRRFSRSIWLLTLGITIGLGYAGQFGIGQLQRVWQESRLEWMNWFSGGATDAFRTRSAIGRIGRLKLSNRIVAQVETDGHEPPGLLREAAYEQFKSPSWFTTRRTREAVTPESDGVTWILHPGMPAQRSAVISHFLDGGVGLLAVPAGTVQLRDLNVVQLDQTPNGAVRAAEGPGFVRFSAAYLDDVALCAKTPADGSDLEVPAAELEAIDRALAELGMPSESRLPAADCVRRVSDFFAAKFRYSTYQPESLRQQTNRTPLGYFLIESRAGHCEYFATATVLMLRRCGIPARYTVGYSVQEGAGTRYVVRERHAHAWTTAFLDQRWQDLDTTPPSWVTEESRNTPFWQPLADGFRRAWFAFSRVRWGPGSYRKYLLVPLVLLAGVLVTRIVRGTRGGRRSRSGGIHRHALPQPGLDSEYYELERWLRARGWARRTDETPREWCRRIAAAGVPEADALAQVVDLHYRLRFDPPGLGQSERQELRRRVAAVTHASPAR